MVFQGRKYEIFQGEEDMTGFRYRIKKGTAEETLLIPLYARKLAMDLYPDLFADNDCQQLFERLDFEPPAVSGRKAEIGAVMAATRQYDMVSVCRSYLRDHPNAAVVNLGCGLDTSFTQADNGRTVGYHVDLPEVIRIREQLIPQKDRWINIACNLRGHSWMDSIHFRSEDGAVFFASGVFYYMKREEVKSLLTDLARRFPGGKIAFDATTKRGLKSMLRTWLKDTDMKDIGLYFSVQNEQELAAWSDDFASVIRRGYMTGYRDLDRRYGLLVNRLFKIIDHLKMCQLIEIEFRK